MSQSASGPVAVRRPVEDRAWVDFAKGIAIVLVVLYHAALFLDEFDLAGGTVRLRNLLMFIPMPVFFFVAGLTARRMLTWSFRDLWRRRLLPLVYLYLLWSLVRVVFYLVVPHLRGSETAPTNPVNIALLPVLPTSSYWFIWALAIFTVVAWLLRAVPPAVQIALAGILAVLSTTPGLLDANNVGWDRVMQNLVFFLLAVYIPHWVYRVAARTRVWHVVVLAVLYAAIAVVLVALHASRVPGSVLVESAIAVAMTVGISVLLTRVPWLSFVTSLGRQSLQIYLLHLFIVALVLWIVAPFANYSLLLRFSAVLPFALAAIALIGSVLLARVLRRFTWLWVSPIRRRPRRMVVSPAAMPADEPVAVESPAGVEPSDAASARAEASPPTGGDATSDGGR